MSKSSHLRFVKDGVELLLQIHSGETFSDPVFLVSTVGSGIRMPPERIPIAKPPSAPYIFPRIMTAPEDTQQSTSGDEEPKSFTLVVSNKMGIHARPAAMIVRIANQFTGDVWVEKDGEKVNGKSIMGLMMLAAGPGSELRFHAAGGDADTLEKEMNELFEKKFEEG